MQTNSKKFSVQSVELQPLDLTPESELVYDHLYSKGVLIRFQVSSPAWCRICVSECITIGRFLADDDSTRPTVDVLGKSGVKVTVGKESFMPT
jgi:hypothetical protein